MSQAFPGDLEQPRAARAPGAVAAAAAAVPGPPPRRAPASRARTDHGEGNPGHRRRRGSNSSSRSSSRATSAGSSPSCSLAGRGSPAGLRRPGSAAGAAAAARALWPLARPGEAAAGGSRRSRACSANTPTSSRVGRTAADAKEKQFWVTQLRACAKYHMEMNSKSAPGSRSRSLTLLPHGTPNSASPCSQRHLSVGAPGVVTITHHKSPAAARRAKSQYSGQLHEVREMMNQVEGQQKNLVHAIESLPGSGPLTALDQDLLLLKATSAATLSCLGECLNLLQQSVHQAGQPSQKPGASENILGWHGPKSHSTEQLKNGTLGSLPSASANITWAILPNSTEDEQTSQPEPEPNSGSELVLSEDEKSDNEDKEETELGVMEDQRSIILHLISQLKLGMDLTKVVLPTFILEKRSLLEMYADFMAHPDLLLAITAGATPEERVICFVEYYLTAFHEGRKGALAKKPYNPIIGETFHCSWEVPKDRVKPKRTAPRSPAGCHEHPVADDPSNSYKLRFVAEQVSHHPPISCFYCECKEKRLCVNTHVWTKSKFMGMSVGVSMIGEGVLRLLEHGEEYVFTLPSAYARSILTIPWVELGGKVSINCAKTGYSATVIFHTKPFYGGKVHRVTAEVKHNPTNTIVCKAHGEWNGTLEFTYSNGETKVIDTTTLPVYPKKIRPLEKQGPMESRNLWREVTRYLRLGDIDAATEQKRHLEEKQRVEERKRENLRTPWKPKYFIQEGDGWVYFNPLWKAH
uniref:Oxysterol-binding protein n=1 Tax=Macaca fascicularis TaxID=9541 RepID=A0A7N9CLZ9_MACFA